MGLPEQNQQNHPAIAMATAPQRPGNACKEGTPPPPHLVQLVSSVTFDPEERSAWIRPGFDLPDPPTVGPDPAARCPTP